MIRRRRSGASCAWIAAGSRPASASATMSCGTWPCTAWPEDGAAQPQKPATTSYAKTADPIVNRLAPSLVLVNFDMPYSVSGITERNYYGTGVIVDAERGLVAVDRNTVPAPHRRCAADVRRHDRDPRARRVPPSAAQPRDDFLRPDADWRDAGAAAMFKPLDLQPGEQVWAVGMRADGKVQSRSTQLLPSIQWLSRCRARCSSGMPIWRRSASSTGRLTTTACSPTRTARWSRAGRASRTRPGAEIAQENRGMPAELLVEMLRVVRDGGTLHSLEAELQPVPLASARKLGLPGRLGHGVSKQHSPDRRQVLSISRLVGGSPAEDLLRSGDLLLDIDGAVVNRFREVERAVQKPHVRVTVLRDGVGAGDRRADGRTCRDAISTASWCGPARCCRSRIARSPRSADRPGWRLRRVLLVWLAGDALSAVGGSAHRGGRRSTVAGSRCVHQGGRRPRGSLIAAAAHDELEWLGRCHHAEARQALLAGLRIAADRAGLGAQRAGMTHEAARQSVACAPL